MFNTPRLVLVLAGLLSLFVIASPASADGGNTPQAQITNESITYSAVSLQDEQTVAINATKNGKLEIMAQKPKLDKHLKKKLTKTQKKQLKKLLKGHSTKIVHIHGMSCRWGIAIWSPSRTSSGQTVWIPKRGNHGLTFGCLIHGVWRQVLGPPRQWNCGNVIVWIHEELPKGAVTFIGPTVIVSHFTFSAKTTVTAHVHATLSATASCTAGGASASTSGSVGGEGSALVTFVASGKTRAQAKTNATAGAQKAAIRESGSLQGSAKADAKLNLSIAAWAKCSSQPGPQPTPTPQPPHHFVNISCTGFEEVTGGRSFLVDCDVSNDNGATITLDAHSNDGNSRVSGVNCFSQGGTPSCHGAGTFEFRVTGINDSMNIVSSSITATASSNGVDKTFRSDPFPVDPSCTGFC